MSMSSRYFCLKESFSFSTSVSRSQSLLRRGRSSGLVGWSINWVRKLSWSKSSSSVWGHPVAVIAAAAAIK